MGKATGEADQRVRERSRDDGSARETQAFARWDGLEGVIGRPLEPIAEVFRIAGGEARFWAPQAPLAAVGPYGAGV